MTSVLRKPHVPPIPRRLLPAAPLRAGLAGVALLLTVGVSSAGAQRRGPVEIPSGWSDSYFDKLDSAKAPVATIAVTTFTGGELVEERLRFRMSDMLITDLVRSGRFNVLERDRMDAILAEQKLQVDGLTDVSQTALTLGKLLNAELVVFGLVTSVTQSKIDRFSYDVLRSEVSVDVRVVNATTGQVVISETAKGSAEDKIITTASGTVVKGATDYDALHVDAARNALEAVTARLAQSFPLVGVVAQADAKEVFLDAGAARGVQPGDGFVVFRRGREITHPTTKRRLGWEKQAVAVVEVTSADADLAKARIVTIADPAVPITAGDIVVARPKAAAKKK